MAEYKGSNEEGMPQTNISVHHKIVVAASVFTGFLNWGILQSFGTFLPFLLETFSDKRSQASVIHSVLIAVAHVVGVASGAAIRKWGTSRLIFVGSTLVSLGFILSYFASSLMLLYIFIGLIAGAGMSFSQVCAIVVIGKMYSDRSQTAVLSLQNAGTGLGGIILPYLINWCSTRYTVHGGFLLIGGLLLNNFACAIIISFSNKKGTKGEAKTETVEASKNIQVSPTSKIFVLFMVGVTFILANVIGIYIMLLDILTNQGLSSSEGLHCLVVANVLGTLFRLLPLATKLLFKDSIYTVIISSLFGLIGVLTLWFGKSFPSLMVGAIFVGLCDGATVSSTASVIFQVVRPDAQAFSYGLVLTSIGIFSAGVGPLYGWIFDMTQSYFLVLLISAIVFGCCMVIVTVCSILYRRLQPGVQIDKTLKSNVTVPKITCDQSSNF